MDSKKQKFTLGVIRRENYTEEFERLKNGIHITFNC